MKYLRTFSSKDSYKNEILPQVSIIGDEVIFDTNNQVVNLSNVNTNLKNPDKDYVLKGISNNETISVIGKSINISDTTISGTISNSNAAISLNQMNTISISNSSFDASTYNMIEIGLSSNNLPELVEIVNCNFDNTSNNAITIFGFKDNAVINIKNCYFKSVSNALRLSNMSGATNVTVNIEDCVCDKWEEGQYSGFLLLQEYPEGKSDFTGITVNIKNLVGPNGQVSGTPETICGTQDENQVIYLYSNKAVQSYNSFIYPKININ